MNQQTDQPVDEAVRRAAEAEATFTGDLRAFGEQLRAIGSDGKPNDWAALVEADGLLCQLEIATPEDAAQFGSNLVPPGSSPDGTPQVGAFAEAFRPYAERRAELTTRVDAQARYRDFLWLRFRDGAQGSRAIRPYIAASQAANLDEPEEYVAAVDMTLRAVWLATNLRQQMEPTRAAVESMVRELAKRDGTLGVLSLTEAATRLLSLEPDACRQLREDLAASVVASPELLGKQQLLQACVKLARTLGDTDSANGHLRAEGALCEAEADNHTGLVRQHWLREAISRYGEAGDGDSLQRLRKAYEEAGAQIREGELFTATGTAVISLDDVRRDADAKTLGRETSLLAFLELPFELGLWLSWDLVREGRELEDARTFTSLFSHTQLEADGRVQPEPDRDRYRDDFARARNIRWASKRAIMTAGISELLLDEFRKRGSWTGPNLTTVLANIDDSLADAAGPGLVRYEAGDAWAALHILAPQVERAVRVLASEVGARTQSYTPHEGSRWVSMKTLLEAPEVRAALTEDLALNIEAVFIEPYGQNIRNNVAHGAFAFPGNVQNAATLCVLTLLTLGYAVIQQRAEKAKAAQDAVAGSEPRQGSDEPSPEASES